MNGQGSRLPRSIYGIFVVCGASLLLILGSLVHAWQRPVSALSGIAPYSDIVEASTGRLLHAPGPRYAIVNLRPDDRILQYDGKTWEYVQRLNLHQLSDKRPGESIELLILRGYQVRSVRIPVTRPDLWERLVLLMPVLSSLVCWLPTTLLLWSLSREWQASETDQMPLAAYQKGIPLWVLTWQAACIAQSMESLKYPVAVLGTYALLPIVVVLVALTSLPYPLSHRATRPAWLPWVLVPFALLASAVVLWHGVQSPFFHPDWRRQVWLLRPSDGLALVLFFPVLLMGGAAAMSGMLLTTISPSLVGILRIPGWYGLLPLRQTSKTLATRLERVYGACPPGVAVIARFHLLIVTVYLLLDLLPRLAGSGGSSYSVLFAAIPLSYLLLWSDLPMQEQVLRGMNVMFSFVLIIQIPNLFYRLFTPEPGANAGDVLTILFVGGGTLLGGVALVVDHWYRQRSSSGSLPQAIDELFGLQHQEAFWHHLVNNVGKFVGVNAWMWITRSSSDTWHIVDQTAPSRSDWLERPVVRSILAAQVSQVASVVVDSHELPITLLLLPVYRDQHTQEVLLAANPQRTRDGIRLLDPIIVGRLRDAVATLRFVERQRQLVAHQQQLAEERRLLADAYRQLERKQTHQARTASLIAFALLHRDVLQRLPYVADVLRRQARRTPSEAAQQSLLSLVDEIVTIDVKIREILQDLRVRVAREQLTNTLEDMMTRLQQEHPAIRFISEIDAEDPPLSDVQRDLVFLVVQEALENAIEHASPTTIRLTLRQEQETEAQRLRVSICDDGPGFAYTTQQASSTSLGLLLMSDLAEATGGELAVTSQPGRGCCITLTIPGVGTG
jgi:signal transduction histidine kinase